MKFKLFSPFLILISLFVISACNTGSGSSSFTADLKTDIDSSSYSFGYQNGLFIANEGATESDININDFAAGFADAITENEKINEMDRIRLINQLRTNLQSKAEDEAAAESAAFFEENRQKEGIMETESGLQYEIIEEGTGVSPNAEDVVVVHYEGSLIDGQIFDSSYERGETIEFPLNRVIRGWTEGVQLMKEGATYMFYIPQELAYGANAPQGSIIKPYSPLVFKVELFEVKKN